MEFIINDAQLRKLDVWVKEQYQRIVTEQIGTEFEQHHFTVNDVTFPYFGACGGELIYQFTPTSIGEACVVYICKGTYFESHIDLTEYENW
jgi:hypothetical protein